MQTYVLAISLLLMIAVAAVFWWAVRNSAADAQGATTGQVESYRAGLFWALVGFGVVIAFAATYVLAHNEFNPWWLIPGFVAALLAGSVVQVARARR